MLLFALFTTISLLWTFQTLPDWIAEREDDHQKSTLERYGALRSGLDTLSAADEEGSVSQSFPLGARPIALLQDAPSTGELSVESDLALTGTFTNPSLHIVDGTILGRPTQDVSADVLADIVSLRQLAISLATSSVNSNDEAWVQAVATDGTQTVTIRVTHAGRNAAVDCDSSELRVTVTAVTTTDHVLVCGLADTTAGRTVLLLDEALGTKAALRRLDTPYTITMSDGASGATSTGSFMAVWTDSNGLTQVAGAGQSASYSVSQTGGRLVYAPEYQELDPQALSWEGGAVVRSQAQGSAVVLDPAFSIQTDGDTAHLRWTMVRLDGNGGIGGDGSATATVVHSATSHIILDATGATFTIDSPNAAAWRQFFTDRAVAANVAAQATVSGTGDTAQLDLASAGPITTWRLELTLVEARVGLS